MGLCPQAGRAALNPQLWRGWKSPVTTPRSSGARERAPCSSPSPGGAEETARAQPRRFFPHGCLRDTARPLRHRASNFGLFPRTSQDAPSHRAASKFPQLPPKFTTPLPAGPEAPQNPPQGEGDTRRGSPPRASRRGVAATPWGSLLRASPFPSRRAPDKGRKQGKEEEEAVRTGGSPGCA